MTDAEKIQMAVALCRERAGQTDSPTREIHLLWAELLPGIWRWETQIKGELDVENYLTAVCAVAVTLASHAIKNVLPDGSPKARDWIGEAMTAQFAKALPEKLLATDDLAGVIGQLDA